MKKTDHSEDEQQRSCCSIGAGAYKKKIPVQEVGGQSGEGVYFRENTMISWPIITS